MGHYRRKLKMLVPKSVGLTEKGMKILVEAIKLVEDADDDFFDISNNEKENFMKTLNKLSEINRN